MSWKQQIDSKHPLWGGVKGYADERIGELTAICIDVNSTDEAIRTAQAGIQELQLLKNLPDKLANTAAVSEMRGNRRGY